MRATGTTKRQIARELGIARNTVDAILSGSPVEQPDYTAVIHSRIIPKAIARIEQVLDNDTDTARWAMEHTVFKHDATEPVVYQDHSLHMAVGFVPTSTTSTPSIPSTASLAESTGPTEAPAKPGAPSVGLSERVNFSQFSLAELEAEVARRKAQLIEVQPEPANG